MEEIIFTQQIIIQEVYLDRFEGPLGYVYTKPHPEAIPLYRYFNGGDHFYTTILGYYEGYKFESVECYVMSLQ